MAQTQTPETRPSLRRLSPRAFVLITALLVAFAASLYAHLTIAPVLDDYQGPLALLDRLFDIFFAVGLAALAFLVGRKVFRLFSLTFDGAVEELSFSVLLGTGVLALAVTGLALVGWLRGVPVTVLFLLLAGVAYQEALRLPAALGELWQELRASRAATIIALLFCLLVATLAVRAATPPHAFDDAIYHLSVTRSFVQQGRLFPVIDNPAGNWSFLVQMLYAVCLLAKTDSATKLYSLLLGVCGALSLYAFAARFYSRRLGVAAMFAFFAAGQVFEVAVTTRIDVSLAAMLWAATYAMILYFETANHRWLYAAALFAGFAMGVKYTAGIWLFLTGLLFLFESWRRKIPLLTTLRLALVYTFLAFAVASPWFVKNWVWFQNPVYPFVTGEVADYQPKQPRYFTAADEQNLERHFENARRANPSLVESRKWELERAVKDRPIQRPPYVWEYFSKPAVYNFPEDYHYPNYLFLLLPLLLLLPKRRWIIWLTLAGAGFYLLMTAISWFPRYLLPLYPALTLASAYALVELTNRLGRKRDDAQSSPLSTVLLAAVLVVASGATVAVNLYQASAEKAFAYLGGQLSRYQFLAARFYYPPINFINYNLPPDARVMMLGAQMSYGLRRDFIADSSLDATGWRRVLSRNPTLAGVHADLKAQGVTHLLVSYGIFSWGAIRSGKGSVENLRAPDSRPDYYVHLRNWATLDHYSSNYLEQVYSDQFGFVLYRLK